MLSVLTCVSDPSLCDRLTGWAVDACHEAGLDCEALLSTADAAEALRMLRKLDEPSLSTIEITAQGEPSATADAVAAAARQPEHMLLVLLEDLCALAALINAGTKPDGVLTRPVGSAQAQTCFLRTVKRYQAATVDRAQSATLRFGRKTYRLPLHTILYLEALDKKVNVYTPLQCVTVSDSLQEALSQLDGRFLQCHRSYVVNTDAVRLADYPNMELHLNNGARVPISRNGRKAVEKRLGNAGEG